jgi:hypothetical protein
MEPGGEGIRALPDPLYGFPGVRGSSRLTGQGSGRLARPDAALAFLRFLPRRKGFRTCPQG